MLKLADFGSCRGIYSKQPYTEYISTRWYRAPECLLTDGYYSLEMDLWGVGCVFFEITSLYPLFPGTNELDQINRIHSILGTPHAETLSKFKRIGAAHLDFNFPKKEATGIAKLIPHASAECVDILNKLLAYDPAERITARDSLRHAYFNDLRDSEHKRAQALQGRSSGLNDKESSRSKKSSKSKSSHSESDRRGAGDGGDGGDSSQDAEGALPSINKSSKSHGDEDSTTCRTVSSIAPGTVHVAHLFADLRGSR